MITFLTSPLPIRKPTSSSSIPPSNFKDPARHDYLVETVLCPLGSLLLPYRYKTRQLSFRRCRNSPLATWKPPSFSLTPTSKTLANDYLFDAIKINSCVKHPLETTPSTPTSKTPLEPTFLTLSRQSLASTQKPTSSSTPTSKTRLNETTFSTMTFSFS